MKKMKLAIVIFASAFSLASITACSETATRESGGQYMDNTAITAKVKTALLTQSGLKSNQITVETYKGVVQLSGFVDSKAQADLASQTAAHVSGVQRVENDLVVRSDINKP